MTVLVAPLSFPRRIAGAAASAAVVAAIAYLATLLAFFTASGANASTLPQISDFFLTTTLLAFVFLVLFSAVEGYRWWYTAVLAGLVAAALATVLSSVIKVLATGANVTGELLAPLFGTLSGPHLIFVAATTIAAVTAGRRIWLLITHPPVAHRGKTVLVRLPPGNLADGMVTHIERTAINVELADEQWDNYVAAFVDNGWSVIEVPAAAQLPDSVFIEDTVVLFGTTAVIGNSGAESRRAETPEVESTLLDHGFAVVRIEHPGTLDGGDVRKVGRTVYVGRSGRTNAEGIRQLRTLVAPLGYSVVAVPVTRALHLKSVVTALPDGTVIGYSPLVDDSGLFDRYLAVPEAEGAHVVVLADDTVLMAASAVESATLVSDLGYRVVTVDISEFEKLEGSVSCLSVRIH